MAESKPDVSQPETDKFSVAFMCHNCRGGRKSSRRVEVLASLSLKWTARQHATLTSLSYCPAFLRFVPVEYFVTALGGIYQWLALAGDHRLSLDFFRGENINFFSCL